MQKLVFEKSLTRDWGTIYPQIWHAAIVARELKKPCIIGTKVATKWLKDGDEVEIDAERGVVKKVK